MLKIQQLQLRRSDKVLLNQANLSLMPHAKVGIIGQNGAGKSTLFSAIRGEIMPDMGDIHLPNHWRIASVAQETPALAMPAIDYVIMGDTALKAANEALDIALASDDMDCITQAYARIEELDAYTANTRAAKLLTGLGFSIEEHTQAVHEFSGGWRMRLNLAQALMSPCELLLLDEPTNHLDLETIAWLEEMLAAFNGMILIISHDSYFLDAVCTHVVSLADQQLTLYTGNYTSFERQRAEHLALQQQTYEKQQKHIQHLQSFITRFKAKASKAKQAQSRVKALDKLSLVAAANPDSPFDFHFDTPDQMPNPLISFHQVDLGYSIEQPIVAKVNLSIESGARIGLLGVNGAGKSTLIKSLANELAILGGEKTCAKALKIAYFAQHQLEALDERDSPLSHFQRLAPREKEQSLRGFLGGFNFKNDQVNQIIASLSGGEKARLVLATLVWSKPNFLLLDEPTNHLDLSMRQALTFALQSFEGSLVLVSHDRALLEACTDELWLVHDRQVTPFAGDLDDYRQFRLNCAAIEKKQRQELAKQGMVTPAAKLNPQANDKKNIEKQLLMIEKKLAEAMQAHQIHLDYLALESSYADDTKEQLAHHLKASELLVHQIKTLEGKLAASTGGTRSLSAFMHRSINSPC
jgi:ATP-binding cassette subfamily F protein 3